VALLRVNGPRDSEPDAVRHMVLLVDLVSSPGERESGHARDLSDVRTLGRMVARPVVDQRLLAWTVRGAFRGTGDDPHHGRAVPGRTRHDCAHCRFAGPKQGTYPSRVADMARRPNCDLRRDDRGGACTVRRSRRVARVRAATAASPNSIRGCSRSIRATAGARNASAPA